MLPKEHGAGLDKHHGTWAKGQRASRCTVFVCSNIRSPHLRHRVKKWIKAHLWLHVSVCIYWARTHNSFGTLPSRVSHNRNTCFQFTKTTKHKNWTHTREKQGMPAWPQGLSCIIWGCWFVWGQRDKDVFSVSSALYSLVWTWPLKAELKPAHMTGISDWRLEYLGGKHVS